MSDIPLTRAMRGIYPNLHAPKGTKRIEETNRTVWKSRERVGGREEKLSASCHFLCHSPEPPALKLAKKEMPLSLFRRAHTSLPMETGLSQFGCI